MRGSCAYLLLALPVILQPHSCGYLPGSENNLGFFHRYLITFHPDPEVKLAWQSVSLFDAEDFTKGFIFPRMLWRRKILFP